MRGVLALAACFAALALTPSADAVSSYCSPTGDYCISSTRQAGAVFLQLRTFSFRGRVRICVTNPAARRVCRTFPLRARPAGVYEVKIRWHRHFPNGGRGTYRVRFFTGATALGPVLTFRIR